MAHIVRSDARREAMAPFVLSPFGSALPHDTNAQRATEIARWRILVPLSWGRIPQLRQGRGKTCVNVAGMPGKRSRWSPADRFVIPVVGVHRVAGCRKRKQTVRNCRVGRLLAVAAGRAPQNERVANAKLVTPRSSGARFEEARSGCGARVSVFDQIDEPDKGW